MIPTSSVIQRLAPAERHKVSVNRITEVTPLILSDPFCTLSSIFGIWHYYGNLNTPSFLTARTCATRQCLGSIDANPDMWLRLMLGGPMHEMGVEYTKAIVVLLKHISIRMWDRDISDIAVDRAR